MKFGEKINVRAPNYYEKGTSASYYNRETGEGKASNGRAGNKKEQMSF